MELLPWAITGCSLSIAVFALTKYAYLSFVSLRAFSWQRKRQDLLYIEISKLKSELEAKDKSLKATEEALVFSLTKIRKYHRLYQKSQGKLQRLLRWVLVDYARKNKRSSVGYGKFVSWESALTYYPWGIIDKVDLYSVIRSDLSLVNLTKIVCPGLLNDDTGTVGPKSGEAEPTETSAPVIQDSNPSI